MALSGPGVPGNGMFLRAAHAWAFPGPITVPQEAVYWRSNSDGAGHALDGRQDYVLHFPAGQLPPTEAFWSLTMGDGRNHYVPNALNRYHVGDRSGLLENTDGSVDIYLDDDGHLAHDA